MAPAEAGTLPSAKAVILAGEAEAEGAATNPAESKLKILPPAREAPIGLLRLEADVSPPITKVEFYLEDKLVVSRTRPPYSVEIDLGEIPRHQTVRAVGYDSNGQRHRRRRLVREPGRGAPGGEDSSRSQSVGRARSASRLPCSRSAEGVARQVELYLGDKKLKTWTGSGPYDIDDPVHRVLEGRLPAGHGDRGGRQGSQRHPFPEGAATRRSRAVRVDVVQLHVSALDKDKRFVKGLAESGLQDPGGRPPADDHGVRSG